MNLTRNFHTNKIQHKLMYILRTWVERSTMIWFAFVIYNFICRWPTDLHTCALVPDVHVNIWTKAGATRPLSLAYHNFQKRQWAWLCGNNPVQKIIYWMYRCGYGVGLLKFKLEIYMINVRNNHMLLPSTERCRWYTIIVGIERTEISH